MAARERRETKLQEYYQLANQAFISDNFKQAETWCQLILIEDPGNEAAAQLQITQHVVALRDLGTRGDHLAGQRDAGIVAALMGVEGGQP